MLGLQRDFRTRSRSSHRLIITGFATSMNVVVTTENSRCAVLEWIEGKRIDHACDDSRLPLKERVSVLLSALEALNHLHTIGFIHGDLKPEHIRVSDKRRLKLIDF